MSTPPLASILEALLFASNKPLTEQQLLALFDELDQPALGELRQALYELQESYEDRAIELVLVGSGYQFQSRTDYSQWIARLWEEKPAKYSRALLETLALIAYRQPITRGEIEDIRGVSVSTSIFKTLDERGWIRIVGHRELPGKPGLYATTKQFLDYFGLESLDKLPPLSELLNEDDKPSEAQQLELLVNEASADEVANETSEETMDATDATELASKVEEEPLANDEDTLVDSLSVESFEDVQPEAAASLIEDDWDDSE